ncbi:hypothetical protein BTS2_0532 [Bacillus sp. TS-2]|nr:hypothetical protein BTS2_0532 [Bacillus sp. TS-2]
MARQPEVKVKFSVFNQEYKKGMEEINDSNKKMKNEMKLTEAQMKLSSTETEKLEQKVKRLGSEKENVAKKIELTEKQLEKAKEVYGENSAEAEKLADDLVKLQTSEQRLENAITETNQEIEAQQAALNDTSAPEKYRKSLEEVGKATEEFGGKVEDVGRGITDFGKSYSTKVTAPILAGGAAFFKASMDFESAFANFRKVTDATEEEFAMFNQAFRDLAMVIPVSTEEIANTAAAASQLGIEKKSVLGFTESMLAMGVASDMTSESAAFTFARLANITGMAQTDFDRLSSTVVDLGNNFAATESEIANMALRIAGAGTQINMSEADILGFSTALSSVGIRAEMGGSAISKLMIEMAASVDTGGASLKDFSRIAGMSTKDFKKAFEEDAATAIFTFLGGLAKLSEEGESAFAIIDELGMSEIRLRDTILRSSSANEMATKALKTANSAWKENTALQDEAAERYGTTESQLIMMWNRIKDVAITLGNALIPAVMSVTDVIEPLAVSIEDAANAFSEMDEEQQRSIIKMVALVAAVGPAAIVVGTLTTALGTGIRMLGRMTTAIGTAKGSGLIARLAFLTPIAGPVALAIAGITGIGLAVHHLTKDMNKSKEVNLEYAYSLQEMADDIEATVQSYEELRKKSSLTSEEIGKLLDIQYEMQNESDPEKLESLAKAYAEIQKESGLSKEELEKLLETNNKVIEQTPQVEMTFSDRGRAIVESTGAVYEHISAIKELALLELRDQRNTALENEKQLREDIVNLTRASAELSKEIELAQQISSEYVGKEAEQQEKVKDRLQEIMMLKNAGVESAEELERLNREESVLIGMKEEGLKNHLAYLLEQKVETHDQIELKKEELAVIDEIDNAISGIYLEQLNVNEVGEKGIKIAKDKLKELIKERDLLIEHMSKNEDVGGVMNDQLNTLNQQINEHNHILGLIERETSLTAQVLTNEQKKERQVRHVNDVLTTQNQHMERIFERQEDTNSSIKKGEENAKKMNGELGKSVDKKVKVDDEGTAAAISAEARRAETKRVTLNAAWSNVQSGLRLALSAVRPYATGTNFHPGGPAILGDGNGPELVREGRNWSIADLGVYNLKRGAQVFTHEQTVKIMNGMKNLPAYAGGVGGGSAFSNQMNQMSINFATSLPQSELSDLYIEPSDFVVDGRVLGEVTWKVTKQKIDRSNARAKKLPRGR